MIIFSRCPYCGLNIGRNSDYCPRCMKHFSYQQEESQNHISDINVSQKANFLSRNLQRTKSIPTGYRSISSPLINISLQRRFFRFKILFAFVLAIVVFIMIKSSIRGGGNNTLPIDLSYFITLLSGR